MLLQKLKPDALRSEGCVVGLLATCELQGKDYTNHLSADERAQYMHLPNRSRKSQWLAGRLAAKYLFLSRLEMGEGTCSRAWPPTLARLSSEALDAYSSWMYQRIEVLLNGVTPSRYRKLTWCGKDRPESISLSHAGGECCASIAMGPPTAVDVETIVPRIDAFYRSNFTKAERSWVGCGAEGDSVKANWFFTLLWSLKESALKLGWLDSLWNLPSIEISGLPGPKSIGPFGCGKTNDFVVFAARVKEQCRVMPVRVAVTGTSNFILTVVNPQSGAVN